jgi:hypothetical protein
MSNVDWHFLAESGEVRRAKTTEAEAAAGVSQAMFLVKAQREGRLEGATAESVVSMAKALLALLNASTRSS